MLIILPQRIYRDRSLVGTIHGPEKLSTLLGTKQPLQDYPLCYLRLSRNERRVIAIFESLLLIHRCGSTRAALHVDNLHELLNQLR